MLAIATCGIDAPVFHLIRHKTAQDGKIIQYFGRVKLYCIPVILYSTDSYKQLPCNAILMIHMIVL